MSQRIYKLWQARFTEAWYRLSPEEQQQLLSLSADGLQTVGGKELILCSADWSNERWPWFGLEEFPDLEAEQRHRQILNDANWGRYMEARTTLGTEFSVPE